jgi:hypothetical protein
MESNGSLMSVLEITANLRSRSLPAAQKHLLSQIEQENLFPVAFAKSQIADRKRLHFETLGRFDVLLISSFNNYDAVSGPIAGLPTQTLPHTDLPGLTPEQEQAVLRDKLVILTSNTVNRIGLEAFSQLADRTPHTIYAVHDIDSHHWFQLGILLAGVADVYLPGHPDSFLLPSRINPHVVGGIPIGSTQWHRGFLEKKLNEVASVPRSDAPFGPHSFYPDFLYRNQLVTTFAPHSPEIRLQVTTETNDFLKKSAEDRWSEWASRKLHLIAPVSNDIPNRFFDALITGGLPLVPTGLRTHLVALGIPEDHFLPYSPTDIADPPAFFERALRHFNSTGPNGCFQRARFTLENFHAERILGKIAGAASALYLSRLHR